MMSKSYIITLMVLVIYFLQNNEGIGGNDQPQGVTVVPSEKPGMSIIKIAIPKIKRFGKNVYVKLEVFTEHVKNLLRTIRSKTSMKSVKNMLKEIRAKNPKLSVRYDKAKQLYHVSLSKMKNSLMNIKQSTKRLGSKAKNIFKRNKTSSISEPPKPPEPTNPPEPTKTPELSVKLDEHPKLEETELYEKWKIEWKKIIEKIKKILRLDKLKPYLAKVKKTFSQLTTNTQKKYKELKSKAKNLFKKKTSPSPT